MLASKLIQRARSLSDTPNSLFISNSDEINSLQESWKDVYSKITESSDDYFIKEVILDMNTAVSNGPNEWLIDMPTDMYKIRYVDYRDSGRWVSMTKFNTNARNGYVGQPSYRMKNQQLWISGNVMPSEIRLSYYPPPIEVSVPELPYSYCGSYPAYDKSTKIKSPYFFSIPTTTNSNDADYLVYIYNDLQIKIESTMYQSVATLYTSLTAIDKVYYNSGYIYFLSLGNLYRATTDYVGTLVPVEINNTGTVQSFSIQDNILYFATSGYTYSCNLDGTNIVTLYNYHTTSICKISSDPGIVYYLGDDSFIYRDGVSLAISTNYLASDSNSLYYIDAGYNLHKYTYIDSTSVNDVIIANSIIFVNNTNDLFIATTNKKYGVKALSILEDTDFIYPVNEANEIMAYQSAIDFKRKQNGDITLLAVRLSEIEDRFMDVLVRDSYQPERRSPERFTGLYY